MVVMGVRVWILEEMALDTTWRGQGSESCDPGRNILGREDSLCKCHEVGGLCRNMAEHCWDMDGAEGEKERGNLHTTNKNAEGSESPHPDSAGFHTPAHDLSPKAHAGSSHRSLPLTQALSTRPPAHTAQKQWKSPAPCAFLSIAQGEKGKEGRESPRREGQRRGVVESAPPPGRDRGEGA